MLRTILRKLLIPPVTAMANKWNSAPDKRKVHASLDALYEKINKGTGSDTEILSVDLDACKVVIVSDQHKGIRNNADDFRQAADTYCSALHHYFDRGFTLINNGDAEELWENKPAEVIKANNAPLAAEAEFQQAHRYYRLYGNHDLEWKYPLQRAYHLHPVFGKPLSALEGMFLQTHYRSKTWNFFITHGHQGDRMSDGNTLSMWFVAGIWTPLQRFLNIQLDTAASSYALSDRHNIIMYEWTANKPAVVLITGHTHKPVFASMDHIDILNKRIKEAAAQQHAALVARLEKELNQRAAEYAGKGTPREKNKPSYFNTGCCCYADGDMTCLEWEGGMIRLVKWQQSARYIMEEKRVSDLLDELMGS